jgi:hypothetical protein
VSYSLQKTFKCLIKCQQTNEMPEHINIQTRSPLTFYLYKYSTQFESVRVFHMLAGHSRASPPGDRDIRPHSQLRYEAV